MNKRLGTGVDYAADQMSKVELFIDEKIFVAPLRWKRPRMIFVCSMTDLFADFVSDEWLDKIFAVMALTPRHTYQILTKRPERMQKYLATPRLLARIAYSASGIWHQFKFNSRMDMHTINQNQDEIIAKKPDWPLPNVWLGISAEIQEAADERIPLLLQTPAAVRWVSYEPAIGPVDFTRLNLGDQKTGWGLRRIERNALTPWETQFHKAGEPKTAQFTQDNVNRGTKLDWIVIGGESGPHARPFDVKWARDVIAQCKAVGAACFVKQLGANTFFGGYDCGFPNEHFSAHGIKLKHSKGGDMSEWEEDLRVREWPK